MICLKCRYFIAMTQDGKVVCALLGKVEPMVICKYYKPDKSVEGKSK